MKNPMSAQFAIRFLGSIVFRMLIRQINQVEKHCGELLLEGDTGSYNFQTAKLKGMQEDLDRLSKFLDEIGGVL